MTFGPRGAGLSRGKRPKPAPEIPAAEGKARDYTPSSIEIVQAPREFKSPLDAEKSAAPAEVEAAEPEVAAAPEEPLARKAPAPRPKAAFVPEPDETESDETESYDTESEETESEERDSYETESEEIESDEDEAEPVKRSLEILPPAPQPRREERWERGHEQQQDRREPSARRERSHQERRGGDRDRRRHDGPRHGRDTHSAEPRREQHAHSAVRPHAPQPAQKNGKSGGFFGWLKSLFGIKAEPEQTRHTPAHTDEREGHPGRRRRRRRRGGQGRPGGSPQAGHGQHQGEPRRHHSEGSREGGEGGRRRRRRPRGDRREYSGGGPGRRDEGSPE